jgi:LPXTG-motif cell wall-anchored protein
MRRILLALAISLLILFGAPATVASANPDASDECHIDDPTWQVSWTSEDAVTLRECGGEGGWAESGAADETLPVTGWKAGVTIAAAIVMLALGAGMYLAARRRRLTFTT